jgi:hypothetical protein
MKLAIGLRIFVGGTDTAVNNDANKNILGGNCNLL